MPRDAEDGWWLGNKSRNIFTDERAGNSQRAANRRENKGISPSNLACGYGFLGRELGNLVWSHWEQKTSSLALPTPGFEVEWSHPEHLFNNKWVFTITSKQHINHKAKADMEPWSFIDLLFQGWMKRSSKPSFNWEGSTSIASSSCLASQSPGKGDCSVMWSAATATSAFRLVCSLLPLLTIYKPQTSLLPMAQDFQALCKPKWE